jgi:hypothetical protein
MGLVSGVAATIEQMFDPLPVRCDPDVKYAKS